MAKIPQHPEINMLNKIRSYILYPLAERKLQRNILSKLKKLQKHDALPYSVRKAYMCEQFVRMVEHAATVVPYYTELFSKIRFQPQNLRKDFNYIKDIPYLNKDIIVQQGERMLNRHVPGNQLHIRKTGGSTGRSTLIYYDQDALDWTAASNLRVLEWMGKMRHHTEVHLSTFFPEPQNKHDRRTEWVKCQCLNRINVLTDSFDPESLDKIWAKLKKMGPHHIEGHPSTLYALALHVLNTNQAKNNVIKTFESTGELFAEKKRQTIENAFSCKAYDRYGNAEFGVISHELPDTRNEAAKVVDFMVYPETTSTGDSEEIILTGLTNWSMPLIRYQTGDKGSLEEREDGLFLKNIEGRIHDIVTINGTPHPTHYIQDTLDRIGGIEEFQILTLPEGKPELRLVVPNEADRTTIKSKIQGLWNDSFTIRYIEIHDLLRQGWRNKFRYVVDR